MNITEENMLLNNIEGSVRDYSPITLAELEADHLMSRWDEKYVFQDFHLESFLRSLTPAYKILAVNNKRFSRYDNTYFDTADLKSFHEHHNEIASRYKIRFRRYDSSGTCFLEVKKKDNRQLTIKERLQVDAPLLELNDEHHHFLYRTTAQFSHTLKPKLQNQFTRITLVNESSRERVTLDVMIRFKSETGEKELNGIAIAEVKQEQHYYESAFKKLMQSQRIFPVNISKYCMGIVLTNPGIKHNRFKPKLRTLNKMCDALT